MLFRSVFERIPQITKQLNQDAQQEVLGLIEKIEEDEDVQQVYHALEIQE